MEVRCEGAVSLLPKDRLKQNVHDGRSVTSERRLRRHDWEDVTPVVKGLVTIPYTPGFDSVRTVGAGNGPTSCRSR